MPSVYRLLYGNTIAIKKVVVLVPLSCYRVNVQLTRKDTMQTTDKAQVLHTFLELWRDFENDCMRKHEPIRDPAGQFIIWLHGEALKRESIQHGIELINQKGTE